MPKLIPRLILATLLAAAALGPEPAAARPAQEPAPAPEDLEEFVPTEQVEADDAVSFPVDI